VGMEVTRICLKLFVPQSPLSMVYQDVSVLVELRKIATCLWSSASVSTEEHTEFSVILLLGRGC